WEKTDDLTLLWQIVVRKNKKSPYFPRKRRLFACGCCRQIWHRVKSRLCKKAVEISEKFADGEATEKELVNAGGLAAEVHLKNGGYLFGACTSASYDEEIPPPFSPPNHQVFDAAIAAGFALANNGDAMAGILKDVFGNPFKPIRVSPQLLAPNITALARRIYKARDFQKLPALSEILEKAGCEQVEILDHCRKTAVHVRGCWVVDLFLPEGMIKPYPFEKE